jgi:hypothetical protein
MAARRKNAEAVEMPVSPFDVLVTLVEMEGSEENPTTVDDIASDLAEFPEQISTVLDRFKAAGIAEEGAEGWYLLMEVTKSTAAQVLSEYMDESPTAKLAEPVPAEKVAVLSETAKPKRTRRTKAQIAADKEKERGRLEYATRAAESQDAVMSQAPEHKAPKPSAKLFKPAPDALPKGAKVVLSDGSVGTVISDEVIKVKAPDYVALITDMIETLTQEHTDATNVRDGYGVPDEIQPPALPQGVAENTWNGVFNAYSVSPRDTFSARLFYAKRALAQHTAAIAA